MTTPTHEPTNRPRRHGPELCATPAVTARFGLFSHPPRCMPNTRPTALDRLAAHAVVETLAHDRSTELPGYHGLLVLDLVNEVLGYSPAQKDTRLAHGNQQRLMGALLTYQRHFAPDEHWVLVDADIKAATLTWACRSAALPPVIDTLTRTRRLAEAALDEPTTDAPAQPTPTGVLRACNLTEPNGSLLQFPTENSAVPWCPADDPIRMRELAFPTIAPATSELVPEMAAVHAVPLTVGWSR